MAFIDGTVVNVALPAIQTGLHATVSEVQWIVESYALLLAALLLVGGVLGDLYGRRLIFVLGTVLFTLGSAWCGFAGTIHVLIAARGLQGVGAALLVPGSLALISANYPVETRGQAIGTWSGLTAATAAIGPVIGGWLVEHASWRWAFFLNLPVGAAVLLICALRVPETAHPEVPPKLDIAGAVLATVGLGGITFGFIEARHPWPAAITGVVGLAALAGFVVWEGRAENPMVSLELFRSRNFSAANVLTLLLYTALSGMLFFYPMDLIQIQRYTATEAGAALLPVILLMFVLSRWSGGLVERYGARLPLTVGPAVTGVGFALAAIPGIGGSYWTTFFPSVVLIGLGMSLAVAPLTTTVMNALPEEVAGVASGVNNAISRVASLLAVAVLGLLLVVSFNRALDRRLPGLGLTAEERQQVDQQRPSLAAAKVANPKVERAIEESFVAGYRLVLLASAGLALAAGLIAWVMIEAVKPGQDRSEA